MYQTIKKPEVRKKLKEIFSVFCYFNNYSWSVLRHETIFLILVFIFETHKHGIKSKKITEVLKRGENIKQSDRNRTWLAGKRLIEKGYVESPKKGYYQTTIKGRHNTSELIMDMLSHFDGFKVLHL